jgi:hypothetical protein
VGLCMQLHVHQVTLAFAGGNSVVRAKHLKG